MWLTGKTFTGTSSVKLTGLTTPVTASFTVVSSTTLKVTVPSGAIGGPITVTNAGGPTTSGDSYAVKPKITGFSPANGPTSTVVTVNGSGFDGTSAVSLNGTAVVVVGVLSANVLKATVPAGATSGLITVTTGAGGTAAAGTPFKVKPRITGFTPSARVGEPVTITGTTFDGATVLKFGAIPAIIGSNDGSVVQTTVPDGATTGKITIVTPGGTFTTVPNVLVPPRIDSLSASERVAGQQLTILGKTLGGVSSVKFSGHAGIGTVSASFSYVAGGVKMTVPSGAVTGPVRITNAGGPTDSGRCWSIRRSPASARRAGSQARRS